MAESFDEGSKFYEEHRESWEGFVKWGTRGTVATIVMVIVAFIFIAT